MGRWCVFISIDCGVIHGLIILTYKEVFFSLTGDWKDLLFSAFFIKFIYKKKKKK